MLLIIFIYSFISNLGYVRCLHPPVMNTSNFISCFEHLGCLETTHDWFDHEYRPKNLEPLDRHTIKTEFIYITRSTKEKNPLNYEVMIPKSYSILGAGFHKGQKVVFLIHDFTSNGYTGWIKHMARAILNKHHANVISVDWEAGAEPPLEQAVANARVVALETVAFIETLQNSSFIKDERIHIIGHGVGAHIAGYIGKSRKIWKITGLDPTGPYFAHMPPIVRLDESDASYVEVLHTDAFNSRSQGTTQHMGHVDFIFNAAKNQPQCNHSTGFPPFTKIHRDTLKEGEILPACSHKRAFKYYIEALESEECEFIGVGCPNFEAYTKGNCSCNITTSPCTTFGLKNEYHIDTANKSYFVSTSGESPFCMNAYQVTILLEENEHSSEQSGTFELIMVDRQGMMANGSITYPGTNHAYRTFTPGQIHTLIFYVNPPRITDIIEGRVKWIHNPNSVCLFCQKSIWVTQVTVQLQSATGKNFPETCLCPIQQRTEIKNGNFLVFKICPPPGKAPLWMSYTEASVNLSTLC